MTAKILESFEESNPRKLQLVQQWLLSNVDDSHCKKHLPVCFHGKSSFYLTELPDVRKWPETVKAKVFAVLVDRDMKEDLERGGLINWCFNVRTLVPIHVSSKWSCLLLDQVFLRFATLLEFCAFLAGRFHVWPLNESLRQLLFWNH